MKAEAYSDGVAEAKWAQGVWVRDGEALSFGGQDETVPDRRCEAKRNEQIFDLSGGKMRSRSEANRLSMRKTIAKLSNCDVG